MTAVLDLPRYRAALARLDAVLPTLDADGWSFGRDLAAGLAEGDPVALALVEPPTMADASELFTLRLPAALRAELDALTEALNAAGRDASPPRPDVKRQAVVRMALESGVRALRAELDGAPPSDTLAPPSAVGVLPGAATVHAAARVLEALARLPPEGVAHLAVLVGRAPSAQRIQASIASVHNVDVDVHNVHAAADPRQIPIPGTEPVVLRPPQAIVEAALAQIVAEQAAEKRAGPENRRKPPRRGGRRDPDPVERRGPERLTEAEIGQWVRSTAPGVTHRNAAHLLRVLGAGGMATFACDEAEALATLARAEGGRRCSKCLARAAESEANHVAE